MLSVIAGLGIRHSGMDSDDGRNKRSVCRLERAPFLIDPQFFWPRNPDSVAGIAQLKHHKHLGGGHEGRTKQIESRK